MTCFYRLEEGGKPALHSNPSTVTVLDLKKPNISVSTEHTETHIHCEAPPDITGAKFFLYSNKNRIHTKETQAGTEERAFSFTVPRSSDSTLTYCCSYQFKGMNSKLSDCAEAKNKDQSGRTKDQRYTTTDNPQTAVTDSPSGNLFLLPRKITLSLTPHRDNVKRNRKETTLSGRQATPCHATGEFSSPTISPLTVLFPPTFILIQVHPIQSLTNSFHLINLAARFLAHRLLTLSLACNVLGAEAHV
ncbi:uncharacterized protein LOC135247275 isoform X1 [Anguilla rostrata]|uniref:uncharacterized protein LOC135247275 isoform X1 n=1 Tax=Anguilla rostrata TaxID=7938 RepID=UPI0030CF8FF5